MKKKFYITTAIDYPNGKPHLGHAYEKICTDCIARWHRLKEEDVFFLTGTDEHGIKIAEKAKEHGKDPKDFVEEMVPEFKKLYKKLNISYERFIRTTDNDHEKVAQTLLKKVYDKGDIYEADYEGWYCIGCESYITEKELVDGKCPEHNKAPMWLKEESYFFKMSRYQEEILDFLEKNKNFIQPSHRQKEMINRVKSGLKDLSISRKNLKWGIPVPFDNTHTIFVWFDALVNYLSGIDYPKAKFKRYWPADVHVIGKDILWFHSAIWLSMLKAMNIEPPKKIFAHGFINTETGKMSKSVGNVIDPMLVADKYGSDALRYFLIKDIPFGQDGIFSEEAMIARLNGELANDLGNLVNRVLVLIEKNFKTAVKGKKDVKLERIMLDTFEKADKQMEALEIDKALETIWEFIREANKYVNDNKPWEAENKEDILYNLQESLRCISIMIYPFMPETAEKISKQLDVKVGKFKDLKFDKTKKIKIGEILFKKIE